MKLKSTFAVILGALMLSEGAFALSCARPDLVKTLEEAKTSDTLYHILAGKFVSETRADNERGRMQLGPEVDGIRSVMIPKANKAPKITRSWFEGYSIAKDERNDGQLTRYPVDIETRCVAGTWCSSPPNSNREIVAFVEAREGNVPLLRISACPKWIFSRNVPVHVGNIRQCLDKDCTGLPLRSPDAYTHPRPK